MHEAQSADADLRVYWRAFELRPAPVPTLDPGGEYLRRVWAASVYPLAERLGMTMRLPPVQPRSRLAHEASHWAREQGRFTDYNRAVFRAFFERGEDIGETDVLVSLADALGLDAGALRAALAERRYEAGVVADELASERAGVSGVPAYVVNGRAMLSGVLSAAELRTLVARVRGA